MFAGVCHAASPSATADLGLRLADLGPHEERDDVAVDAAAQLHAVDAAPHVLRDGEVEIVGPAAVVQIVVVEMNRGVVMRRPGPVALRAGPGRALHGPRRQVDQPAVQPIGRDIEDLLRGNAEREIPGCDDVRRRVSRRSGANGLLHFGAGQCPLRDTRAVDLPVEERHTDFSPARTLAQ